MWDKLREKFSRASVAGQLNGWKELKASVDKNIAAGEIDSGYTQAQMLLKLSEFFVANADKKELSIAEHHLIQSLDLLAGIHKLNNETEKHDSLKKRALNISDRYSSTSPEWQLDNLYRRAELMERNGEYVEALVLRREGLQLAESIAKSDVELEPYLGSLGFCLSSLNLNEEAEKYLRRCVEIKTSKNVGGASLALSQNSLASVLYKLKRVDEAESCFRAALKNLQTEKNGDNHPVSGVLLMFLAVICISKGQLAEADGFFEKCLSGIEKRTGKNSAATAKCLEQYAKLLQNQNRDEQASLLASRARHIREKLARR